MEKVSDKVYQLLQTQGLETVKQNYGGYYLQHKNTIDRIAQEFAKESEREAARDHRLVFAPFDLGHLEGNISVVDYQLASWLNWFAHARTLPNWKAHRKTGLWIYGRPNSGKSRFLKQLSLYFSCYDMQFGEQTKWQDNVMADTWDLCCLDEFKGQRDLPLQALNRLLDGDYFFEIKYHPPTKLPKMGVVVVSNEHPWPLYQESVIRGGLSTVFEAMLSRFNPVYIGDGGGR